MYVHVRCLNHVSSFRPVTPPRRTCTCMSLQSGILKEILGIFELQLCLILIFFLILSGLLFFVLLLIVFRFNFYLELLMHINCWALRVHVLPYLYFILHRIRFRFYYINSVIALYVIFI